MDVLGGVGRLRVCCCPSGEDHSNISQVFEGADKKLPSPAVSYVKCLVASA